MNNALVIKMNKAAFWRQLCLVSFLCMAVFVSILSSSGISGLFRTAIMGLLVYFPVVIILLRQFKSFPYDFFILLAAVLLLYYITIVIHPEYKNAVQDEMWDNIVSLYRGIIGYLFIRLSDNPKTIRGALLISAFILFSYYFVNFFSAIQNGYWKEFKGGIFVNSEYSMSFGYGMLFPCLIFAFYGFKEKKVFFLALSAVGGIEIFMFGSRAAPMSFLVFILMYLLLISAQFSVRKSKVIIISAIVVVAILFILFYQSILLGLANELNQIGISSRTITRMIDGTLMDDNIRAVIWKTTSNYITSSWLFGKGFLADRYLIGNYCHNIILELLLDFGYIIGGSLVIFIFWKVFKMLFRCKDPEWLGLFLIFFSCSFARLMVSYSFWCDTNFWIAAGICVTYQKKAKTACDNNAVQPIGQMKK